MNQQDERKQQKAKEFNDLLKVCHQAADEYLDAMGKGASSEELQPLYDRVILYNRELSKVIPAEEPLSSEA